LIDTSELESLRGLDAGGHLALSLYLDVGTPERRRRVMQRLESALQPLLSDATEDGDRLVGLREDVEMVRLHFATSAGALYPYVAIFSCAPQCFWRVYPLSRPVKERIRVGECFDLTPLEALLEPAGRRTGGVDLLAPVSYASV
jgi:hypothetical protein